MKAYKRRGESINYNQQQSLLTKWRSCIDWVRSVPVCFERDALRRVDRGMKAFFRRVKSGEKPGYPRFKSWRRYNSLEYLAVGKYLRGDRIHVPCMGSVRCRGRLMPEGVQKGLRIVRRASGWYAQFILDNGKPKPKPETKEIQSTVGIDMGLEYFASTSDGEHIDNPRFARTSQRKLRALQRKVSRRKKGSGRRRRAVKSLQRHHERIAAQRKSFCHQHSTALVQRYDLIAVENLNVSGMSRSSFGKSILDAAWTTFTNQLKCKAEDAGKSVVFVNPRGTSQTCPDCGSVKPKKLSERVHSCECGCRLQRDVAAAKVILSRALVVAGVNRTWTEPASGPALVVSDQAGRMKREVLGVDTITVCHAVDNVCES